LERHVQYTGSTVAANLLANWDESLRRFVRVMPRDYARVLKKQQETAAEKSRTQEKVYAGR